MKRVTQRQGSTVIAITQFLTCMLYTYNNNVRMIKYITVCNTDIQNQGYQDKVIFVC